MGIKNAEFDADFESIEKTGEKVIEKKLEVFEHLPTALKDEK